MKFRQYLSVSVLLPFLLRRYVCLKLKNGYIVGLD